MIETRRLKNFVIFVQSFVLPRKIIDIDMLLIVENGITVGMCHEIRHYAKVNNKYTKDYDENKE